MKYTGGKGGWYQDSASGNKIRLSAKEAGRRNAISESLKEFNRPSIISLGDIGGEDLSRLWHRVKGNKFERILPSGRKVRQKMNWEKAARNNSIIEGKARVSRKTEARKGGLELITPGIFKAKKPKGDVFIKIYERNEKGKFEIVYRATVSPDQFYSTIRKFMKPSALMLMGYYAISVEGVEIDYDLGEELEEAYEELEDEGEDD